MGPALKTQPCGRALRTQQRARQNPRDPGAVFHTPEGAVLTAPDQGPAE
jgi:hypothetical protein